MSIIIRDETANAAVLIIDNNGNMAFGDGTPINLLTLNGAEIIDSNGYIVNGLSSCTPASAEGAVTLDPSQTAVIATLPGRTPTVQLDSRYPAHNYSMIQNPVQLVDKQNYSLVSHKCIPLVGQFSIWNRDTATSDVSDNQTAAAQAQSTCGYRWI
jgi:hypothetical protein